MAKVITVNFVISEGALYSTVFNIYDTLLQVGVFWNYLTNKKPSPRFKVSISGLDNKPVTNLANVSLSPHRRISNRDKFDVIIIPSEGMEIDIHSPSFLKRVAYIKKMHSKGSLIVSVCTGAFLLAAAGLLDKKIATTHWAIEKSFRDNFPKVKLDTNLILADAGDVITSGGVRADLNLAMELVSKFCGKEVSHQISQCTLVSLADQTQQPFKVYFFETSHGDQDVLKCQNYIKKNINLDLSVEALAKKFNFSSRNMNRRFQATVGLSVLRYIQQVKIEEAKSMLIRKNISFEEVSFQLGYKNISFFRRLFKKVVGLTPKEYRDHFIRFS